MGGGIRLESNGIRSGGGCRSRAGGPNLRNSKVDEAVVTVRRSLRVLHGVADALRERTVCGIVELLMPALGKLVMLRFHLGVRRARRD